MERSPTPPGGIPCPGCPIYPHIRDEEFRFPSCELCRWPAIGIGSRHVWRCAHCRHRNEHGRLRPRIAVVLLRLEDIDPAARRLDVVDPQYGRYVLPRDRRSTRPPCTHGGMGQGNSVEPRRVLHGDDTRPSAPADGSAVTGPAAVPAGAAGGLGRRRDALGERVGLPVYARASVAGLPVLIVGGDRPYPHPLGLAEHDPEPCSFSSRATRIACPCDQPPPCLRGQALYAHVVSPPGAPAPTGHVVWPATPAPTGHAMSARELIGPAG